MTPRIIVILLLFLPWSSLPGQNGVESLAAPTGVEASDGAFFTKVTICWDHIRHAKTYEIFRGETDDPAAAVSVGTTRSVIFDDESAEPEKPYFYWVRARNGNVQSRLSAPDQGLRATGKLQPGFMTPLKPPPVPPENRVTGAKVYLGKTLFWDEQLSSTRTTACGTCHRPRSGSSDPRSNPGSSGSIHPGADGVLGTPDDVAGSPGVPLNFADGSYGWSEEFGMGEQVTHRKALPVINAAYFESLLWDGRARSEFKDPFSGEVLIPSGGALESQALQPLKEPVEMSHEGGNFENILPRLIVSKPLALSPSVPAPLSAWIGERSYPELFAEAFGTPEITGARMALAIASYERTLYSDRTPLDRVIASIEEEPPAERRGREVFIRSSCGLCHQTGLLGDNFFRYIGLRPAEEDVGRFKVTGDPRDTGRFRTPNLRNIALRGPYMHDGRFATLEEVVEFYDRGGDFDAPQKSNLIMPLELSEQNKSDLVAFMRNSLTDPRVEAESGPLFDRPMLYSESARVPRIEGEGTQGSGGLVPQVVAIEPPLLGNPSFTVGLYGALGSAQAVLVIDNAPPGEGPLIPASASLARESVTLAGAGPGEGYGSVSVEIPNDPALAGATLFGRWFVVDPGAAGGVSVSPRFRMTVFGPPAPAPEVSNLSNVSAASLAFGFVARGSLVTGFGTDLSTATQTADSSSGRTTLAGISVAVQDSTGSERLARLFYVSPGQINYQIPFAIAEGEATVSVLRGGIAVASGKAQIAALAPALFSANADGRGPASALVLRAGTHGSSVYEQTARFDEVRQKFVSTPIDLGPQGDDAFLILFGTGLRHGSGTAGVSARIGGEPAEVLFAGPQGQFAGLDQINLRLPHTLAGRGEVDVSVTVDGETCNTVSVHFE